MNGVTVITQMHDVLSELIADGFTKIVVMNAHFENEAFIVEAIDLVTRETGGVATIVETNWWDPVPQSVSTRCSMDWCSPAGHWSMRPSPNFVDAPLRAGTGAHGPYGRGSRCHGEILCTLPGAPR